MELFYCKNIPNGVTLLDEEESRHCVKVLRHKAGDSINVIDGCGTLYHCIIENDSAKGVTFRVKGTETGFGSHGYHLHLAVAPPKNPDRFEWFAEKATEIGVDEITPVFGDFSERKVFKSERVSRILVSAAKQSYKGSIPILHEAVSVKDLILSSDGFEGRKIICYCDDLEGKVDVRQAVRGEKNVLVMIGPEGDFSPAEVNLAKEHGFLTVSLGESRLRIETAAVMAAASVYLENM